MFFPVKPRLIDKNRAENGDYYKKPTQYWFVNCEPEANVIIEPLEYVKQHTIENAERMERGTDRKVKRSLMHTQYARRFIVSYILDAEGGVFIADETAKATGDSKECTGQGL